MPAVPKVSCSQSQPGKKGPAKGRGAEFLLWVCPSLARKGRCPSQGLHTEFKEALALTCRALQYLAAAWEERGGDTWEGGAAWHRWELLREADRELGDPVQGRSHGDTLARAVSGHRLFSQLWGER